MAEKIIALNITVEDENDCVPVIKTQQVGSVYELSATGMSSLHSVAGWLLFFYLLHRTLLFYCLFIYFLGTLVMKVIATDADKPGTAYSKISYSIARQSSSAGMFYINSQTGEVFVHRNTLDREVGRPTNLNFFSCSRSPYHTIRLDGFVFPRLFFFFCQQATPRLNFIWVTDVITLTVFSVRRKHTLC